MPFNFPTALVFTDLGDTVRVEGNGLPLDTSSIDLPKESYQLVHKPVGPSDCLWLKPLNGAEDIGYILHANVVTPATADIGELLEVLGGFFSRATSGLVFSGTYDVVIAREAAGTLPDGLVRITDREGGVILPSMGSVLGTSGTALFYDINWDDVPHWAADAVLGTISYTSPSGGPVAPGTPILASNGWTGVSILDNGTNSMTAYQTSTGFAWPGNGETLGDGGVFSVTVSSSIPPVIETLAWYLAPDGYHVYGVTDVEQLDGTDPATNVAAWSIVPGGAISAAFTKSTSAIEFDKYNAMGGDPGIVVRRNNGVVDATYTYAMDQIFGMGYSALGLIKWNSPRLMAICKVRRSGWLAPWPHGGQLRADPRLAQLDNPDHSRHLGGMLPRVCCRLRVHWRHHPIHWRRAHVSVNRGRLFWPLRCQHAHRPARRRNEVLHDV
jgi:hypothetical protein